MTPLVAAVAALAVYRATLLVVADEISDRRRQRAIRWLNERKHGRFYAHNERVWQTAVARDPHRVAYLLGCSWCASPYVAPAVIAVTLKWGGTTGWWLTIGTLAASGVTGFLARYATPDPDS